MFEKQKRFDTKLSSIPINSGIEYMIELTKIPSLIEVDSNPSKTELERAEIEHRKPKTFKLIRFNDVKLNSWSVLSKKEVESNTIQLLSSIELGSIMNLDLSKKMSNVLMDFIDNEGIKLNQVFKIKKVIDKNDEFLNSIEPYL